MHKGHQTLISGLNKLAKKNNMAPLLVCFPLPPKTLLSNSPELTVLTLPDEKYALLKHYGAKNIEILNFKSCRHISRENFFDILLKRYNMGGLLVGRDFAFGKERKGHIDFLRAACAKQGVKLVVADFYGNKDSGGHKISSSLIRKTLLDGHIRLAGKFLGRKYTAEGIVVTGKKLGRKLGFPTANLGINHYKVLPQGVFSVEAVLGKEKFKGVANIGFRPTVNPIHAKVPLVEVHILNFNRDIYGKNLSVNFVDKIRGEKKFDGLPALIKQMTVDKALAEKQVKLKR